MTISGPSRKVGLNCPVCGGDQFKHTLDLDEIECVRCGHVTTKQRLMEANAPNIGAAADGMKSEVMDELRKAFRKGFAGSKHFKLK
jgi:transcription initiation factor TFIIIB Brf1 subunit/transcription initiation factor TFIIB